MRNRWDFKEFIILLSLKILSDRSYYNRMALLNCSVCACARACVSQFQIHLYFLSYLPDHNPNPSSLFLTIMKTSVCFVRSRVASNAFTFARGLLLPLGCQATIWGSIWALSPADSLYNASSALQCSLLTPPPDGLLELSLQEKVNLPEQPHRTGVMKSRFTPTNSSFEVINSSFPLLWQWIVYSACMPTCLFVFFLWRIWVEGCAGL